MSLEEVMKRAIQKTGRSYRDLAQEADIAPSILSLFMAGERTLTLPVANKLCKVLGLELKPPEKKAR